MKVMVTGGSGFVASHLVDHCLKQGDEVAVTIRWNEDLSRMEPYKDKVKIYHCELTDLSSIIRAINDFRPDVISHLGAQSWVPYSFENPIYTMDVNAIGTLNILEAVRIIQDIDKKNAVQYAILYSPAERILIKYNPLIHICSSSEFYGKVPKENQPITTNHPASPMNPYGVGKVSADLMAQLYEKYYDMRILITRMFTHTGPRRTMMSAECFYAKRIAEIEKEQSVAPGVVVPICEISLGNMNSIRTWRDVRDAVTDYYQLFKEEKTGIYNISGDTTKSIQEVLDYLLSISRLNKENIRFEVDSKLLRKIDVDCQYADISKFKEEIEQTKNYTFEETMQDLLDYWRENV